MIKLRWRIGVPFDKPPVDCDNGDLAGGTPGAAFESPLCEFPAGDFKRLELDF